MKISTEKILISTYSHKNIHFAIGVSESGDMLKSSLPKSRKKDAIDEIRFSFPTFDLSERHKNLAEGLYKAYQGNEVQFPVDIHTLMHEDTHKQNSVFKTPFMRNVLIEVMKISYGEVKTYKDIAETLKTRAYRAVGTAVGRNPLPLIIPCHRIVRSDMSLGGFRGGSEMKKKLLENEGVCIVDDSVISSV